VLHSSKAFPTWTRELVHERSDEVLANSCLVSVEVEAVEDRPWKASSKMLDDRGTSWKVLFVGDEACK
jgi:hypothetical protein